MATDTPASVLAEHNAACPVCGTWSGKPQEPDTYEGGYCEYWPGHALARKLARVTMTEQAKESLQIYDSLSWVNDNPKIREALQREIERIAALDG